MIFTVKFGGAERKFGMQEEKPATQLHLALYITWWNFEWGPQDTH